MLDLGFATAGLRGRLISFLPRDEWAPTRDHIPIEIRMDFPRPLRGAVRGSLSRKQNGTP